MPYDSLHSSQSAASSASSPSDASLEDGRIRRSFDQAAGTYDQAAALQRRVADRLMDSLGDMAPARVLDAGCGTGYGTAALCARFPEAQLYALDLAPGMLAAMRRRVPTAAPVCADIQAGPLAVSSIDLVWSSLMLQWCNRLDLAFANVRRSLAGDGRFVFSTFGPATLHELRASFADGHTHVSRFQDADSLKEQLVAAGFADIRIEQQDEILHYPDVRSLMLELKAIGAHNATAGRARGLTGKRVWQAMLENYETRRTAAGLPATYALIYVSCR